MYPASCGAQDDHCSSPFRLALIAGGSVLERSVGLGHILKLLAIAEASLGQ
jgi:hypothetical protein